MAYQKLHFAGAVDDRAGFVRQYVKDFLHPETEERWQTVTEWWEPGSPAAAEGDFDILTGLVATQKCVRICDGVQVFPLIHLG